MLAHFGSSRLQLFCCGMTLSLAAQAGIGDNSDLAEVFTLTGSPSALVSSGKGGWLIGMDQASAPRLRCGAVDSVGKLLPYPTESMATAAAGEAVPLSAVEDVVIAPDGRVWLLDNGRRGESTPKLVCWDSDRSSVHTLYYLPAPATTAASFLSDLALDPESPLVVISDPANDSNAALLLLDRRSGVTRRVLQGHPSLLPDTQVELPASGIKVSRRLDGRSVLPHSGVRSVLIDDDGQWLYYAPLRTKKLYRLPMKLLRDTETKPEALAAAVVPFADIGPCTSLAIDEDGRIYVGDLTAMGVCWVDSENGKYHPLITDPSLIYPDSLTFGTDGRLYFFSKTTPTLKQGSSALAQYKVFSIQPLAEGLTGR